MGLCINKEQTKEKSRSQCSNTKRISEVGNINGLEGDNEFSSGPIKTFCEENNIRLDTSVAKEEHISNGNKLGIIDRLVRTLRQLIDNYYVISGHRTDNIKDVMKTVIETYNDSSHRGLKNKTPNEVYNNHDNQLARHLNDSVHNQQVYKTVPFNSGDQVRILEKKEKIDKGKQNLVKSYIQLIRRKDIN